MKRSEFIIEQDNITGNMFVVNGSKERKEGGRERRERQGAGK